jgi:hypothetical protein
MQANIINVQGIEVRLFSQNEKDYICITDIAQNFEVGIAAIESWMRNRNTIEFLGTWEQLYNPHFNSVEFDGIRMNVGLNTFKISVKKWTEATNAIGLYAKTGRYGGTYAHKDIAIQFCYWLSPTFQLYLIKEFQRLKEEESTLLNTEWNLKRQLAKANWYIHTEAVREHLVPLIDWNTQREALAQASEADLLNLSLFGMTAREWKQANPMLKGNIRDHATTEQLLVLANLQSLNAKLLEWDSPKEQRLEILNKTAREQMEILVNTKAIDIIKKLE